MIQTAKLGLTFIEQPSRQRRAEAVGAAAAVVEDEGLGIVAIGAHQQLLEQGNFGVLCGHNLVFSPFAPERGDTRALRAHD